MTEPEPQVPTVPAPEPAPVDPTAAEVVARSVFRTLFRDGVHLPVRMNGLVDMDVVVKDSDVLVNLNQVQAELPQLSIWRITFAYQGKPVIEYGRGIRHKVKIHFPQAIILLLSIWKESRRKAASRSRWQAARERDLLATSVPGPKS